MPHPPKATTGHHIRLTAEQAATLRKLAQSLGCTYAGEPSISLLNQKIADFLILGLDSESDIGLNEIVEGNAPVSANRSPA